jgi:hypothetical protein
MYYIRIWRPDERTYTVMKSAAVIAETLGIDIAAWPPSTKTGARYIASEWLKAGGKVNRKNDPLLVDYCLEFWDWEKSDYIQGKLARGRHLGRHWCHDSQVRIKKYIKP